MVQHPQRLSESRTGYVLCVSCSQSNIMLVCSLSLSRDSFSVHGRGRYKALPLPVLHLAFTRDALWTDQC